jgi:hypothetical protein
MKGLKLKIEDELWQYLYKDPIFNSFKPLLDIGSCLEKAELVKPDCLQITDLNNLVVKSLNRILNEQNFIVNAEVFQNVAGKTDHTIACIPCKDNILIHYHPILLEKFSESEIEVLIAHEVGHYIFQNDYTPDILMGPISNHMRPTKESERFNILANMLAHLNEYNCDRYALFIAKDLNLIQDTYRKNFEVTQLFIPNSIRKDQLDDLKIGPWQKRFVSDHPLNEDRETALKLVKNKIQNINYDINDDNELINNLLQLVCYNEFIEEYGDFYLKN